MPVPLPRTPARDCLFCLAHDSHQEQLAWYDTPLIKQERVGVALCGVGAFVPGYVLVSPAMHKSSVQGLPAEAASQFIAFLDQVLSRVEEIYGPATLFEHGSCRSEERRRSACITHSHIHVIPGAYAFDSLKLPVRRFGDLSDLLRMPAAEREDGYLMYREPGGMVCYSPDAGISQYFRRHIADVLGRPSEWDYVLFPNWDNIRATQDSFASEAPTINLTQTV